RPRGRSSAHKSRPGPPSPGDNRESALKISSAPVRRAPAQSHCGNRRRAHNECEMSRPPCTSHSCPPTDCSPSANIRSRRSPTSPPTRPPPSGIPPDPPHLSPQAYPYPTNAAPAAPPNKFRCVRRSAFQIHTKPACPSAAYATPLSASVPPHTAAPSRSSVSEIPTQQSPPSAMLPVPVSSPPPSRQAKTHPFQPSASSVSQVPPGFETQWAQTAKHYIAPQAQSIRISTRESRCLQASSSCLP